MNCMQPKLFCAHTFDARPTLPATRRGSAVLDAMADRVELGGQAGAGRVVGGGAGRVGQDRAGPGRSSCERTHEWFLEMCVPSELARGIKLATNLDTLLQF